MLIIFLQLVLIYVAYRWLFKPLYNDYVWTKNYHATKHARWAADNAKDKALIAEGKGKTCGECGEPDYWYGKGCCNYNHYGC